MPVDPDPDQRVQAVLEAIWMRDPAALAEHAAALGEHLFLGASVPEVLCPECNPGPGGARDKLMVLFDALADLARAVHAREGWEVDAAAAELRSQMGHPEASKES